MSKHTVYSPVEDFTGVVAFVPFHEGKGETDDPRALAYFGRHGYRIEEPEGDADGDAPAFPDGEPTDKGWTKAQLTAWAEAHDVPLGEAKTKGEVLATIAAATADPTPVGATGTDGDDGDPGETE